MATDETLREATASRAMRMVLSCSAVKLWTFQVTPWEKSPPGGNFMGDVLAPAKVLALRSHAAMPQEAAQRRRGSCRRRPLTQRLNAGVIDAEASRCLALRTWRLAEERHLRPAERVSLA